MTKEQILEAAAQIFSQKGYHATSMQDIANAVEIKKASLYHHIENKQEILLILLNRALELVIQQVSESIKTADSPANRLATAMRTYLAIMASDRDLAAVLLLEYRSLEPKQFANHISQRDRFEKIWRDLISEGMDAGLYETSDPANTARAILGVLNWTIMWYQPKGSLSPAQIADHYTELILHGLVRRNAETRLNF